MIRMQHGWTGGQYSLYRIVFGGYLAVHFALLMPYGGELFSNAGLLPDGAASPLLYLFPNLLAVADDPAVVTVLLGLAVFASLLLALGKWDRIAALLCWYALACLFGRNPLIANPSLPYVGWLLLVHAVLPASPFGSFSARNRVDPGGNWHMPASIFAVAWILMAVGYTYSGLAKLNSPSWLDGTAFLELLQNPLARDHLLNAWMAALPLPILKGFTWGALAGELLFAPLAIFRRCRPWLWLLMLAMHLGLLLMIDFADLTLGMIVLHLFTFNPDWLKAARAAKPAWLFYDGHCGLCHGFVRFVLAEDRIGVFKMAPLQGETIVTLLDAERRASLPDSVVVLLPDGTLRTKWRAVTEILRPMGGLWFAIGTLLRLVPRPVGDWFYERVAAIRTKLFAKPKDWCPMLPAHLRDRMVY